MESPCAGCDSYRCLLGERKQDCLAPYENLRRIGNSPLGFGGFNDSALLTQAEQAFLARMATLKEKDKMAKAATGAPRGRRPKKTNAQADQLVKALAFVGSAVLDMEDDLPCLDHVQLHNKMAIVYSRQISAGHPIEDELTICPHLKRLQSALTKTGKTLTMATTANGAFSVTGDGFRAIIPTISIEDFPEDIPDQPCAVIDDRIKVAFGIASKLVSESADKVAKASLLLEANTCTGTNGAAMLQVWHGIDLPPHMVIPKKFATAVAASEYKLTGLGFTWDNEIGKPRSVTLWFENGAWIKCQCYSDRWPDIGPILNVACSAVQTPDNLFASIAAIEEFSDDKEPSVYFHQNKVSSHSSLETGAQFDVAGLNGGKRFNSKLMKQVAPYAATIDLTTYKDKAFFFGMVNDVQVRGAVMGMYGSVDVPMPQAQEPAPQAGWSNYGNETSAVEAGYNDMQRASDPNPIDICSDCGEVVTDDGCGCDDSEVNPHVGWNPN